MITQSQRGRIQDPAVQREFDNLVQQLTALLSRLVDSDTGLPVLAVPIGGMIGFLGTDLPTGWLWSDGAAVSRTTYSMLFEVLGVRFGVGNGTTTFNLPVADYFIIYTGVGV